METSNRLDNFDAKEARRLTEKSNTNQLQWVLQEIKRTAESHIKDNHCLYVYKYLKPSIIKELERRGFAVTDLSNPVSTPDINLHYVIEW